MQNVKETEAEKTIRALPKLLCKAAKEGKSSLHIAAIKDHESNGQLTCTAAKLSLPHRLVFDYLTNQGLEPFLLAKESWICDLGEYRFDLVARWDTPPQSGDPVLVWKLRSLRDASNARIARKTIKRIPHLVRRAAARGSGSVIVWRFRVEGDPAQPPSFDGSVETLEGAAKLIWDFLSKHKTLTPGLIHEPARCDGMSYVPVVWGNYQINACWLALSACRRRHKRTIHSS